MKKLNDNSLRDKVYRLKSQNTPLALLIDTGSAKKKPLLIWDTKTKQNRAIRYAENQKSIYVEEQDENPVLSPIVFEDGFLSVPSNKPNLQTFLEHHPKYNSLYELIDEERDAHEDLEILNAEDDARQMARELTIDQAEMVARVLIGADVDKLTSAEIKRDVRLYATNYPESFLELLNDPDIKLQYLVASSFDQRLIVVRNQKKDIHWNLPENKKRIITIPKDVEPDRALISYLISDEGKEALEVLEKLVE